MSHVEVDDAALISQASGGRALRGLPIIVCHENQAAVGKQLLLRPPTDVSVMNSNQAAFSVAYCFSRSEESASFSKSVMDKGWSIATRIHAEKFLWGASVDASFEMNNHKHHVSEEKLSRKVSEACITQCIYTPISSFQIPRGKMILSEAALDRALAIKDAADADDFLASFNPFVSESLYHLGGVFFKEVSVKCTEETSLFALMSQTQEEMKGSLKGKVGGAVFAVEAEASVKTEESTDTSSRKSSAIKLEESIEKTTILGPSSARDDTEFLQNLKDDPHCRAIIDKAADRRDSLISVWELLLQHSQAPQLPSGVDAAKLKSAAKILCERWLYLAERRQNIPIPLSSPEASECYSPLINQSKLFIANLSSDPMLAGNQTLPQDPPQLPPLPDLPKEASLTYLVENLNQVLVDGEALNISQDAANHAKFFIREGKSAEHYEKALKVFQCYGFDRHGDLLSQLDHDHIKSMIQELKEIQNAPRSRENIPPSAWGPDLTFPSMSSSLHESASYQFQYFGDVLLDRNFHEYPHAWEAGSQRHVGCAAQVQNFQQASARRLIDCLRHRLNPLKHLLQGTNQVPTDSWDSESEEDEEGEFQKQVSPFELLIQIMQGSDLPTQIAVCDLLLSQRSATPLILPGSFTLLKVPHQEGGADDVRLAHYIQALSFVNVNLEKEQKVCIADDISLPRVVFISNRSMQDSHAAIIASRVLNCDFMSQYFREDMCQLADATVMEVGIGFIPTPTTQGESEYFACLSIQITGPYHRVMSFVDDIADVVVLELEQGDPNEQKPPSAQSDVLRWQETDKKPGRDIKKRLLWGQETNLVSRIGEFLYSKVQKKVQKVRTSMLVVCNRHFPPGQELNISFVEGPQGMVDQYDFSDIRKKLTLQRSLVVEAKAYFQCFQLQHDPASKHEKEKACVQERDRRLSLAKDVINIPMMKLFYHLLKQDAAASRRFGIMWFERALSQKMYLILEDASQRVDNLFQAFNRNPEDVQAKKQYIQAKQDYVEKSVGLDNFWRELCHIYEADPTNQRQLARQAAQHLLDGFPLEILDGDAGMFCKIWVETVLVELESMTKAKAKGKSARIFVLSVMGLQSSGKTTMLNLMFGSQLRTSAGRCTRGVYIQLVPSERAEYDFVLLLDTEGLRSPEYFGLEASGVRDNRLATFGLLPADACMFMVSNEDDGGLKEVLPMVLLAFKGSAIAERCGQRIKAKVVFVYRSVDTNDTKKLKGNKQKLHEHLREAAEEVAHMGGILSSSKEAGDGKGVNQGVSEMLLSDLRVDEDEKKSDVKFMGNLKKGSVPPTDTPEWAYGERVVDLREYLHARVINDSSGWKALSFAEWAERLTLVWDCICTADFELSFRSKMEYASYLELQANLQPPRAEVHKKYMDVFSSLESRMRGTAEEVSSTNLLSVLEADVKVVVVKQTDEVDKILNMKKSYAKWRPQELDNWKRFCATTKDWYTKRIADLESGVLRFERVVAEYRQQCKSIIVDKIESGEWNSEQSNIHIWRQKFEEVFKRILEDAERKHRPIANDVHKKVMDRYKEAGLAQVINMYANDLPTSARSTSSESNQQTFFARVKQVVGRAYGGDGDDQRKLQEEPIIYSELQLIIDRQLRDARQYSEITVDNVISATKESLEAAIPKLNRDEKKKAHIWVKNTLTKRLKEIQNLWDKDHNVVEKLKSLKTKDSLYDFFSGLASGLEAAALLVRELQRCLEDELEEAHSAAVVSYVATMLGSKKMVRDWRIMRALLDYHLLSLMEIKDNNKLLRYVSNGPLHFEEMMNALVGQAITRELVKQLWDELLQKVQNCLKEQASIKNPSVQVFLASLNRVLAHAVDGKLANAVTSSIHVEMYKDRNLESDFYEKKLPKLCESLQRKAMPDLDDQKRRGALIKGVMKEMEGLPDENCRPRCAESCPRCGSTCFLAAGHIAARHDCVHQPAGLSGAKWIETEELGQKTCLQMLETNCSMVFEDGTRVPYTDFAKHYSSWTQPSSNESIAIQVRECIFFNYQEELVNFFSSTCKGLKRCPPEQMPTAYNHSPARLQAALYNQLRPKFEDDQAWSRFSELLKSH